MTKYSKKKDARCLTYVKGVGEGNGRAECRRGATGRHEGKCLRRG